MARSRSFPEQGRSSPSTAWTSSQAGGTDSLTSPPCRLRRMTGTGPLVPHNPSAAFAVQIETMDPNKT